MTIDPSPSADLDLATCPLEAIDPGDPRLLPDPYPYFKRLREEAPVYRDPRNGVVYISTYALIEEILRQPLVYSNDFNQTLMGGLGGPDPEELAILAQALPIKDTMLTADPPAHTRYKKLAMKAFTFKRVEGMGDHIASVTNMLIDRFIGAGRCEFKSAFADNLPSIVIADALGVPRSDLDQFHIWLGAAIARLGGHMTDRETRLKAARLWLEMEAYFVQRIAEKRRNPSEDIISDLVHATLTEEGDSRPLDDAELMSMFGQIFVAGQETTAHSLTAGLFYLLTHPDQFERLKSDPSLTPNFVEETLRYLTPVNSMWRLAVQDAELAGAPIRKGELLLLRFGSGDRDPAHFDDPEAFDIARPNAREHLAFGGGIHTCLGAPLARKEMNIAFPILLERLKNIRLVGDPSDFTYVPNPVLRGVTALNITFDPA